ncbi:uncharacterized protein ANIA_10461 [Aspergillus nidulans FGSC A4]|uniref:Uncharacterized protein n=1 Tax=Emericella nidulans (strain FGSC A4 / ATCC 38163 / CBS 112.46 / NRRL 194 / M139) TaxID=227321 RepID=C8V6T9_EMENI|nr:hypothetical protein [Aspergillus nidulans FGSC A4]CBF75350.1 TPA: hypothetical protein ANIA_10461 [Aspergillus nidulans FGSC A4]
MFPWNTPGNLRDRRCARDIAMELDMIPLLEPYHDLFYQLPYHYFYYYAFSLASSLLISTCIDQRNLKQRQLFSAPNLLLHSYRPSRFHSPAILDFIITYFRYFIPPMERARAHCTNFFCNSALRYNAILSAGTRGYLIFTRVQGPLP